MGPAPRSLRSPLALFACAHLPPSTRHSPSTWYSPLAFSSQRHRWICRRRLSGLPEQAVGPSGAGSHRSSHRIPSPLRRISCISNLKAHRGDFSLTTCERDSRVRCVDDSRIRFIGDSRIKFIGDYRIRFTGDSRIRFVVGWRSGRPGFRPHPAPPRSPALFPSRSLLPSPLSPLPTLTLLPASGARSPSTSLPLPRILPRPRPSSLARVLPPSPLCRQRTQPRIRSPPRALPTLLDLSHALPSLFSRALPSLFSHALPSLLSHALASYLTPQSAPRPVRSMVQAVQYEAAHVVQRGERTSSATESAPRLARRAHLVWYEAAHLAWYEAAHLAPSPPQRSDPPRPPRSGTLRPA
ncbi:uncharacterized protein SCHCODRAFT_02542833 [Schizophyllum commune H4-8]|uniref:uncharacterized protein n=1 Tax=Schizophyllum commune (strain H4-8 / FGSC 9210) TaxID=578458 RepID=UPI00215F1972